MQTSQQHLHTVSICCLTLLPNTLVVAYIYLMHIVSVSSRVPNLVFSGQHTYLGMLHTYHKNQYL